METVKRPTPTNEKFPTREAWLMAGAELLWPRIVAAGGKRPEVCRVSCGWPSSSPLRKASSNKRTLGEAWHAGSEDEAREVFISPVLAKPVEVLDVLAHELVHAACEAGVGHGPVFAAICRKIGLTDGKPTQARAGELMLEELAEMAKGLGPYPHAKLDRPMVGKQTARQMLVECPDCGCKVRMARSWIETYLPTCGCGSAMVSAEYEVQGEPVVLEQAAVSYLTKDGAYRVSTTKERRGTRVLEGRWLVTFLGDDLLPFRICASRADALAFIAAHREGDADFAEVEVEEDDELELEDEDLGELGVWEATEEDLFLGDDEPETADYADGELRADEEDAYEEQTAIREASGERTSGRIIARAASAMD